MTQTYYYIARRKQRGYVERYAGDGIIEATSVTDARKKVARYRGVPFARVTAKLYVKS